MLLPSGRYSEVPLWVETSREVEAYLSPPLSDADLKKVSTSLYPGRDLRSLLYYLLSIYPVSLYFFNHTKYRIFTNKVFEITKVRLFRIGGKEWSQQC